MFRTLVSKISDQLVETVYDTLYSNPKRKQIKEKFETMKGKHRIELPTKVFIDSVSKKKLDLNSNYELGINNLCLFFTELFNQFDFLARLTEELGEIFAAVIEKLNKKFSWFNFVDMAVSCLSDKINGDSLAKYTLISIKHKGIRLDDILKIETYIVRSAETKERVNDLINEELRLMFEKIIENSEKANKEVILSPKTPANSELSDYDSMTLNDNSNHKSKAKAGDNSIKQKSARKESFISSDSVNPSISDIDLLVDFINQKEDKGYPTESKDDAYRKCTNGKKKKVNMPDERKLRTKSDAIEPEGNNCCYHQNQTTLLHLDQEKRSLFIEDKKIFKEEIHKSIKCVSPEHENMSEDSILSKKPSFKKRQQVKQSTTEDSTNIDDEDEIEEKSILTRFQLALSNQSVNAAHVHKIIPAFSK